MAKTNAAKMADEGGALSRKTRNAIDNIRKPFMALAKAYGPIHVKAKDLAGNFIDTFNLWKDETGGSFVAFVREVDPNVPENRGDDATPGYRDHPSFNAASYLRRIAGRSGGTRERKPDDPVKAQDAFTKVLAALVAMVRDDRQKETIYEAMGSQLHWTEGQIKRTRTAIENKTVTPLIEVRGRNLDNLRLVIPARKEEEELPRTGTEG